MAPFGDCEAEFTQGRGCDHLDHGRGVERGHASDRHEGALDLRVCDLAALGERGGYGCRDLLAGLHVEDDAVRGKCAIGQHILQVSEVHERTLVVRLEAAPLALRDDVEARVGRATRVRAGGRGGDNCGHVANSWGRYPGFCFSLRAAWKPGAGCT